MISALSGAAAALLRGGNFRTASAVVGASVAAAMILCSPASAQIAFTSADMYSSGVERTVSFNVAATGIPAPAISITGTPPTGVTFTDNGNGTATFAGAADAGTVASYPLTLTASNGVDPDATQNFTFTVYKVKISAALDIFPKNAFAGEPIAFLWTILSPSPPPTGTVTFTDGAKVLRTRTISGGQVGLERPLPIGTHTIIVSYSGDANYRAVSWQKTVTVSPAVGGEIQANTTTGGTQQAPGVALFSRGYMVVWASDGQDGSGYGIFGQRMNYRARKAGPELSINTTTAGDQTSPKIAAFSDGPFMVVWQSSGQGGLGAGIYAQAFTGGGLKRGDEITVSNNDQGAKTQPAIAAVLNGFVVAWTSDMQDSSGLGVYARRYNSNGRPIGKEFPVNTTTAGDQSAPAIAGLPDGGFVVVWQSADASGLGIFGQRYDVNGDKVGNEFAVNRTKMNDQSLPGVAGLADGGFVAVWQSNLQDGSGLGVFAQRYASDGTPAGNEMRVNTATANDQSQPVVASFGLGGYVVLWTSDGQDGAGKGVYAQVFNASGSRADVEFRVNTTTAGDQWQPAVGGCVISEFRAAWVGPDADGTGVFTQLFFVPIDYSPSLASAKKLPGSHCSPP